MRMLFSRHELKRSVVLFPMMAGCIIAGIIFATFVPLAANAQDGAGPTAGAEANNSEAVGSEAVVDGEVTNVEAEGINIFTLVLKGGAFTIPIGLMSLITVTFVIERSMALRRDRVIPNGLITELGDLAETQSQFDPRAAYRLCQRYPSAAATVIRSMLVKVGRPQAEVDRATTETSEREADRLYGNIRWLNLSAAVSPLLGLLGTVWGMIQAFNDIKMANDISPAVVAGGISVALLTTAFGLVVAVVLQIFQNAVLYIIDNQIVTLQKSTTALLHAIKDMGKS